MHPETEAKAKTLALRTKAKDACSLSKDHVAIHFADNTHLTYYFSIHSFITENRTGYTTRSQKHNVTT